MYLTQSNVIRGLAKAEYSILRELCAYAKNLYNVGLYNIRQHYFAEKSFLSYESNYHVCKDNENYKLLQAGISQQILKVVDRSFKSFFNLVKKAKDGEYRFKDIRMPNYLRQGELFPLILSTNAIFVSDGRLNVPMSNAFKAKYPRLKTCGECERSMCNEHERSSCAVHTNRTHAAHANRITLPFPERLSGKTIKEVRILPVYGGQYFKVQYVYEAEAENLSLNRDNALGIDIGLENLATCADSRNGTPFIMDGRKLKSINHYYNKRRARLQGIADKQGAKTTKRLNRLTHRRNNQCNDHIKKTARHIINHCIANDIGTVVVGCNEQFKQSMNLGRRVNQQFTQISFGALREQLKNLCGRYGMEYVEQEESYTSKASFLDGDEMPVFNPYQPGIEHKFSGRRVSRGLYRSGDGTLINADVNGAYNILRKSKQNFSFEKLCTGTVAVPVRIRLV